MRNTHTNNRRWSALGAFALIGALGLAGCAAGGQANPEDQEESWEPTRDVTMSVPFAAGGGNDTFARTMADAFEDLRPGLTIVVENREGASGAIGTSEVFQQAGNPHRLLISGSNIVTVPLEREVPYNVFDFTPVGQPAAQEAMAVTRTGSFDNLQDVIDEAEERTLTVGVGGTADLGAIASNLLAQNSDAQFEFVIFTSGPEMTRAALTGDVDFAISAPENSIEFVKDGSIHALAMFSPERLSGELADVPTAVEQGFDVVVEGVRGLWAAPDLSDAEAAYWTDLFQEWTETPEFAEYMEATNAVEQIRIGADFTELLETFSATAEEALSGTGS
ncbi:tripartite tricarboxylate transporter substrate binding protein [Microbacterium sp. LWS13-1.2]|uniref:Tripartite tricarboxylate transporter substrate binding protein n=1 Tax=Microbacterium sp. LWS13-1.2 TaxID=3135264 RepID=A0AAU6SE42_9MICO